MRTGTRRLVPTLVGVTLLTTFLPLAAPRPVAAAAPTDLFFSEYIEGISNNKALEIYNGTGGPVEPRRRRRTTSRCTSTARRPPGLTIPLTGTVADGDVYVIAQASANADDPGPGRPDQRLRLVQRRRRASCSAAAVRRTVVDVIGQVGVDPGTEWGTGLTSTADNTLRRKATIAPATQRHGRLRSGDRMGRLRDRHVRRARHTHRRSARARSRPACRSTTCRTPRATPARRPSRSLSASRPRPPAPAASPSTSPRPTTRRRYGRQRLRLRSR